MGFPACCDVVVGGSEVMTVAGNKKLKRDKAEQSPASPRSSSAGGQPSPRGGQPSPRGGQPGQPSPRGSTGARRATGDRALQGQDRSGGTHLMKDGVRRQSRRASSKPAPKEVDAQQAKATWMEDWDTWKGKEPTSPVDEPPSPGGGGGGGNLSLTGVSPRGVPSPRGHRRSSRSSGQSGGPGAAAGPSGPGGAVSPRSPKSARSAAAGEAASRDDDSVWESRQRVEATGPPKRLLTADGALIRSVTREGWDPGTQQPFAARKFVGRELEGWAPVNRGQLLGFVSQKGGQPQIPNQDEFAVIHEAGYQIYLVVDGHGEAGEAAAKFARQWLITALLALVRQRKGQVLGVGELPKMFRDLQDALHREEARGGRSECPGVRTSGCAAVVVVVTPARSLRGAWIGDCQCLAGGKKQQQPFFSTTPHLSAGSPTAAGRLTNAIGHLAQASIRHEADEFVEADVDRSGVDFLILGTGGLWRGLEKDAAIAELSKAGPYHVQHACSVLATRSQENQMAAAASSYGPYAVQDATVLVAWLGTVSG